MTNTLTTSEYIEQQRREYSLYILQQRSICSIIDGLKHSGRRVIWTARDGKKYKTASLAGATMPIHPHASPEGTINTLAAPYGNNIPLFKGDGAFGTLLNPTAYGAARYTSVQLSKFTKDVIMIDMDLIPLQDNYDQTLKEPKYFLPLVPIVLINSSEGIAVGFASTILPRDVKDIIKDQILHLQDKKITAKSPIFTPTHQHGINIKKDKWLFRGEYEIINQSVLKITSLPYGINHEKYTEHLIKLVENNSIVDFEDNSRDRYDIDIKFKRGFLSSITQEEIINLLKLENTITENMNVLNFDSKTILNTNYIDIIKQFTDWRLKWYKKRYERLAELLSIEMQKQQDVLSAIKMNIGSLAKKIETKDILREFLSIKKIVNIDYIMDLPIYRFTEEERDKVQEKLQENQKTMEQYKNILKNPIERVKIYINELNSILKNYDKGEYK